MAADVELGIDEALDGVGDLVLTSGAGFEDGDGVVDSSVEEVNADECEVRAGVLRLFFQTGHTVIL